MIAESFRSFQNRWCNDAITPLLLFSSVGLVLQDNLKSCQERIPDVPLIYTFGFPIFRPTQTNELPRMYFSSYRLNSDDHLHMVHMVPMLSV